MNTPHDLTARVIELESTITHLQHDLEQLSAVLIDQQTEIESLQRVTETLKHQVDDSNSPTEQRNPLDERPPHY